MRLFLPTDTVFTSNGERRPTFLRCIEHREIGDWNLDLEFPLEDVDYIKQDYIIVVKTKEKGDQPFRIRNIEVGSRIKCNAYHVGFDAENYTITTATAASDNCQTMLNTIVLHTYPMPPFTVTSDIADTASFTVENMSMYEALQMAAEKYNGYLDFDGWNISIMSSIGQDRGITIESGKNLESASLKEDWSNVTTSIRAIGTDGLTLNPEWRYSEVQYDRPYARTVQFDTPYPDLLEEYALNHLFKYQYPLVNYQVNAVAHYDAIGYSHEYLSLFTHEQLSEFTQGQLSAVETDLFGIGDPIYVKSRQFTIYTEVLSYEYNVLADYISSIEFGNYRPTVKTYLNTLKADAVAQSTQIAQIKIDEVNGTVTTVVGTVNQLGERVTATETKLEPEAFTVSVQTITQNQYGETIDNVNKNFVFNVDGLEITSSENAFSVKIDEAEMGFYDSGTKTAYINNSEFNINKGRITSSLIVGPHKIENYQNTLTLYRYIGE